MYIHVAVLSNADVDLIITDVDLINAVAVLTLQGTFCLSGRHKLTFYAVLSFFWLILAPYNKERKHRDASSLLVGTPGLEPGTSAM